MRWIKRKKIKPEWARWFAWYPVRVGPYWDNPTSTGQLTVWLEWVERKLINYDSMENCSWRIVYEYRIKYKSILR